MAERHNRASALSPLAATSFVPWRSLVLPLASVAYVGTLAVWVDGAAEPRAWMAGLLALGIAMFAARRADRRPRTLGWGLAIVVASLGAKGASAGLDASGAVGAMVCASAACAAIARIPGPGGLVRAAPISPFYGVTAIGLTWLAAIAARLTPERESTSWMTAHAREWGLGAAVATVAFLLAATELTRRRRRLELGVPERTLAMRGLLGTSCAAALLVALAPIFEQVRGDAVARGLVAAVSAVLGIAALTPDPARVARVTRRLVALGIVGGGVAVLGAGAADGRSWTVTLVTGIVLLLIGASASALESPLRPAHGAWLDACAQARDEVALGDPEDAIRGALAALRSPGGVAGPSPELWTFAIDSDAPRENALEGPTMKVTAVDAAGYTHERDGDMPEGLVLVAAGEPEATLRAEVLDALQVRRPELRPFAKWMAQSNVLLACLVASEGETEGVLVLPRVARDEPITLEEVRAIKDVADRLAAACRARATTTRLLGRVHRAMASAEAASESADKLRHERTLDEGRDALATSRLARPATVGIYSAASRMALEALERRTAAGAPIAVVAPSGVDPVPYLARAHLTGVRREAPFVLVDATTASAHDAAGWVDPNTSPLALADGGMLVLLDGAALPSDVQQLIARALAEKRAPWERPTQLDVQLALTAVASPERLVAQARLDLALATRLADALDAPIDLPRLRDRPEDFRAVLTDRLAREGLRVHGRPVGIEAGAYARLVEHGFPGENAELSSVVRSLVAGCTGDVIRVADVQALGLARGAGETAGGKEKPERRSARPMKSKVN